MSKRQQQSRQPEKREYDHKVLDIARVARVMAGGRRFSFRASVVIGDRNGKVGVGVGKGADTAIAIDKAINAAKKKLVQIDVNTGTVPVDATAKFGSAQVILKPAKEGKGIVAGGATRTVVDLVGLKNITAKMLGGNNKINNARATVKALLKTQ
ncbi:MAG: ribosomal protein [Candidatus Parcubacteria bacterium]|jgi:small subunit ribosomal protein S5|nr:30S ribosomal protein S5 [Candidatus Elulimicrobium humile]